MEVDLRRPTLAQQLDIRSGPGLADVLIGASSISEAAQTVELDPPSPDGGASARTLDVLVSGAVLPPNPGELIESLAQRRHGIRADRADRQELSPMKPGKRLSVSRATVTACSTRR